MKILLLLLIVVTTIKVNAQQTTYSLLKIGDKATILPSAILELKSTSAGMLLPRMTTTQKNAISSPATGLLVFDTTLNSMSAYNGATWSTLSGTVTSVALALPGEFTISGSPVTVTGTLTGTWATQIQNKVFAAPSGSTGTPSFRLLVASDIPDISATYLKVLNNLSDVNSKSTSFNNLSPMTTLGDIIYGGSSGTGTRLAGNTTSTKNFLISTGSGGLATAPTYGTIASGDVPTLNQNTSGTAAIATTGTTVAVSNSANYFPLFAASSSNSNQAFNLGTGLTFNPNTNNLSTTTFTGALAGNATTATTGTNATNTAITDDTSTNAIMYPTWVTANTGNLPQKTTSTKLTWNPSTGSLGATTVVAAVTGTASGNTTYTANNHGVVISGSGNTMTVIAPDASTTKVLTSGGSSADPTWAAASAAASLNYSQAYFANGSSWSTTSTSYASGTNAGGNTLTVRVSSGITLTAGASNKCAIVFTPAASTSIYLIYAQVAVFNGTLGDGIALEMIDNNSVVIATPAGWNEAGSAAVDNTGVITTGGIYAPATGSAVTIELKFAAVGAGTASINAANSGSLGNTVEWTVVQIK